MTPCRRILGSKQFIMDHFAFNLVSTPGVSPPSRPRSAIKSFIDIETLHDRTRSSATRATSTTSTSTSQLLRPRQVQLEIIHTGRPKPSSHASPSTGRAAAASAGRRLARALYAALYVVAEIPLESIMMALPCLAELRGYRGRHPDQQPPARHPGHVVQRHRLSAQARPRARKTERVTIVAHATGCIQTIFDEASIDPAAYAHFEDCLRAYLKTPITVDILANFLRQSSKSMLFSGAPLRRHELFVPLERLFAYEHGSPHKVNPAQREALGRGRNPGVHPESAGRPHHPERPGRFSN